MVLTGATRVPRRLFGRDRLTCRDLRVRVARANCCQNVAARANEEGLARRARLARLFFRVNCRIGSKTNRVI
jgi:hypothetical protein